MHRQLERVVKTAVIAGLAVAVSSCGLPRTGPSKSEIFSGSVLKGGDAFIVQVDDNVTRATAIVPALGFSENFINRSAVNPDTIRPGDTLGLEIWENVDDPLLGATGQRASVINQLQVDSAGNIFVPYAGNVRAAGQTPNSLREILRKKLEPQTPDPQVVVRRLAGDGATVSLVGGISAQGVYPIERPSRTLTSMIAAAGGVQIPPSIARVNVSRGGVTETAWLEDLYRKPELDIAVRPGDKIFIEEDTRAFTALGATGVQNRLVFDSQTISAIEALARVGGISSAIADPTGVFVFRNEPEPISRSVLARDDLSGTQRFVYVLDLTKPNGVFQARDFVIRDGDTVYVTEAPIVTWNKTISALTGGLAQANALASLADSGN